jgi:thiol-disulfide isomerase/thioredoxin
LKKKVISSSLSIVLVAAIVYSFYTNLFQAEEIGMDINAEKQLQSPTPEEGQAINEIMNGYVEIEEEIVGISDHELDQELEYDEHGNLLIAQQADVQEVNIPAPDFELITLTDESVKLSDFRGKKVFINFWATWCPPCKEEMPHIQNYYEEAAKDDNVVILSINVTDLESNRNTIQQFSEDYAMTFPILLDEKGDVSITYEILTLPTSMIINEEGVIVEKIIGPVTEEMLNEKLGK